ncbi:unnamed protein product [Lymnaea stagnalis]|uniref:Uncharacterized protein n=1 Tax=Lymnaea stagnalis TaxID=6523 RepID=A0AAV2GX41_LYMST
MKLRRANLTVQNLAQLLRNEGGGFIGDIVSAVPPQHLHGYELHNIENSAWMNHDKAELITNLESLLVNHNQHQNQLRHNIQQYLSYGRISTILALGVSLLEALNNSFTVNICPSNVTSPAGNISSQPIVFNTCFVLVSEISKMNSINFQLEEALISSDVNTPAEQVTGGGIRYSTEGVSDYMAINITSDNSIISDDVIDDLLNKVKVVQGTSENIIHLHQCLLNATLSFLQALSSFEHDFFKMLELLKEHNQTTQSEAYASYEKLRTGVDIHDDVATTGSIGVNGYDMSTQNWNTQSSINRSVWNYTGVLPVQLINANISDIMELFDVLASNLTQFEDMLILANVTRPIHDPMLDTWTDWHNLRRRTKRNASGFTISGEQCQKQGALINQTNFISLCSTCVHTTVLDNCYFPRFLTEKVCGRGSSSNPLYQNSCLCMPGQIVGGPAGQCQQQRFHIVVLKKTPGRCMKIKSQGQEIITDQWESTTYPLRIGCECVIHQNSMFAKYALFP